MCVHMMYMFSWKCPCVHVCVQARGQHQVSDLVIV